MAMYRHFANKDALLDALMADGLAAWEQIALAIRAEDPLRWLAALADAFLEFALSEPHRFDAAFFLPAPRARQYPEDFLRGRSPVMTLVTNRLEEAKRRGLLRERAPMEVALAFSALAQGLISMQRANRFSSEAQFRKLYRRQMRQCIAGLTDAGGEGER